MTEFLHTKTGKVPGDQSGNVLRLERNAHAGSAHDSLAQTKPGLRVAVVGNYAPQRCGIATFTTDVVENFAEFQQDVRVDVHVLEDECSPAPTSGMRNVIARDRLASYRRAARLMNEDAVDAVWIQHEFGIFGGESGDYILELVDRVAAPIAVTMHTVLSEPSPREGEITRRLVRRASALMVMSTVGRDLLIGRYGADPRRVHVIEHGAPDCQLRLSRFDSAKSRKTLMTFGLLSPGKGLETAIEALPAIAAKHPSVIYRIVGMAHPNQLRDHGEAYRDRLVALAKKLGVSNHIEWDNRFLDTTELLAQLETCDIYLTPYPNLQQSTSGTLSYAVALGRAVVSTPYIHARELLTETGGVLVDPNKPAAIARAVNRLLDNPDELEALQLRTYRRGRKTIWSHFVANAKAMLESIVSAPCEIGARDLHAVPGLIAFDAMCDDTGIMQHGIGPIPDRRHGYCLDDCARALMLINRVDWRDAGEELRRASRMASFVQHAWNSDLRQFRNFMNFDRTWCESYGSEDSNGRAIWALGDTVERSGLSQLRQWAQRSFDGIADIAREFASPRALGFAGLGATALLRAEPGHAQAMEIARIVGSTLEALLARSRRPDWSWFEAVVAYDNPRLPQALFECGRVCGNEQWVSSGLETLRWILRQQSGANGHFRPVGSESFGRRGEILPFDQQPLEAWAAVDACASAMRCEASAEWAEHAQRAMRWFHGANDRCAVLVDPRMGSCCDGVTPHGANLNWGAESLIAFQIAYYSYDEMNLEDSHTNGHHVGGRASGIR